MITPTWRGARALTLALALGLALGCNDDASSDGGSAGQGGDDPGDVCLDTLELNCAMTFSPTFDAFFENRLRPTCGAAGTSCHAAEGAQAGLILDERDMAYESLTMPDANGRRRVIGGDPECSPLMARLESDDLGFVMPVGQPLPEGERCAIRNWIANGAVR